MILYSKKSILKALKPLSLRSHQVGGIFPEITLPVLPMYILEIIALFASRFGNFALMNISFSGKLVFRYLKVREEHDTYKFYMPVSGKRRHFFIPYSFLALFLENSFSVQRKVTVTECLEDPDGKPNVLIEHEGSLKKIVIDLILRKSTFKASLPYKFEENSERLDAHSLVVSPEGHGSLSVRLADILGANGYFSPRTRKLVRFLNMERNVPILVYLETEETVHRVLKFPRTLKSNVKEIITELSKIK